VDAHVLVPLKATDPKSRLAGELSPGERRALMRSLLERVVTVVREAGIERVTVVTGEALEGYDVWADPGLPWNEALAAAAREVVTAPLVAFVSADLPRLQADDVRALLEATPERGIAIGRAHDGGTNAIAMRPPGLVVTHFGEPQSASVHAGLGVPYAMVDVPGLACDIDTPEDLAKWR
jgi:2-phospho-L-lactate/phosphoenolpyruvate guanylyltransferase